MHRAKLCRGDPALGAFRAHEFAGESDAVIQVHGQSRALIISVLADVRGRLASRPDRLGHAIICRHPRRRFIGENQRTAKHHGLVLRMIGIAFGQSCVLCVDREIAKAGLMRFLDLMGDQFGQVGIDNRFTLHRRIGNGKAEKVH